MSIQHYSRVKRPIQSVVLLLAILHCHDGTNRCRADDPSATAATFEGTWRATIPKGPSFYQVGWAVARFDTDGGFSMAIIHQRDKDNVQKLHFYTGSWRPPNSPEPRTSCTVKSLSFYTGKDSFRTPSWTFKLSNSQLTDDQHQWTWTRHSSPNGVLEAKDVIGQWRSCDSWGDRLTLVFNKSGIAILKGEHISLSFSKGGAAILQKDDGRGVFFSIVGRWVIFHDTIIIYDSSYKSSNLGDGQFALALTMAKTADGKLKETIDGTYGSFEKKLSH